MKRLYIIVMSILMLFVWFTFAADFDANVTPDTQNAISWTIVSFDVVVNNNTWFDAYLLQSFPWQIDYYNASVLPINNPALSLWIETTPRWLLSAGQTLNIHVEWVVNAQSFATLNVLSNIVEFSNFANVYTSAIANIEPISDVVVTKVLIWDEPQLTWDMVTYNILIENIWSAIATGISLVDVWPASVLTFPNQWLVDGVTQIPTIYNSLLNNYLFNISDLVPWASSMVHIVWSMDTMFPAGQSFENLVYVLVDSPQYIVTNDTYSVVNNVRWIADVYVTKTQISINPSIVWDEVEYLISYGNNGTEVASWVNLQDVLPSELSFVSALTWPTTQIWNNISRDLWALIPGENGTITVIWSFVWWNVWVEFVNNVSIATTSTELDNTDNADAVTWTVLEFVDMSVELYANNLTDPSRNFNTGLQIFAISGDIVELQIMINNDGNMLETWTVSISNINGFVDYVGVTSWNVSLAVWASQTIVLTWVVGPQNFVSFTPSANLSYNGLLATDDVIVEEPLACGDGLITQTEVCDTNGQIGNMLPWQHCEEYNGQCILVTENITNTVCMEYTTDLWTGEQCMSVVVAYEEELLEAQCSHLSAPYSTVIVDEDMDGDMEFTCTSVDNVIADEIRINCGNGEIWISSNPTSSFTYSCNYEYDENGSINDNVYDVNCYVEDNTCEACHNAVRVDEWFYGVCGDGLMDSWEECDLWWEEDEEIDIDDSLASEEYYDAWRYEDAWYYCEDCRIRKSDNTFVYQPAQCLGANVPISVMEDELMPFRWRLRERDNMRIRDNYDCEDMDEDETRTIIDKDSMECEFAIYNGDDYSQLDNDDMNKFTIDCFDKDDSDLFDYFAESDTYNIDFDEVSGRHIESVRDMLDQTIETYGEYKLVLEEVRYDYCNPNAEDGPERDDGRLYEWVCEVNFALTRPYMMQISTFGFDPIATDSSDFLKDFYDMNGDGLIKSTDIEDTMDVDDRDYEFNSSVSEQMLWFKNRYEPLAIVVDNNFEVRDSKTIWDLFNDAEVKKVPNKLIFFVEWQWELVLKQLTEYFPWTPFTLYIEGMDVTVEWSVKTNGMIITDQKISFEDDSTQNYCEDGWQIVQWIFVAQWWFEADERLRNSVDDKERCERWNLQVKWVLIWSDLENLMNNKRSHLNDWFQVDGNSTSAIKRERKNEIFEGAALLIEYNPDLWSALPPGAESFTQSLDVYRK